METTSKIIVNKRAQISNRRGVIEINKEILFGKDLCEETLKLIYSNFFPIAISENHESWNTSCKLYCYSKYFREVKDGEIIPKYSVTFKRTQVTEHEFITTVEKVEEDKR